jgi:DNA-binding transcriptional LysR family regulator
MDWEDLRFFLAVATQQGLAAAARELGVSQATVWRRIGQLERSLEARLFTRRGSRYALSPTGERLFETANRVAQEIRAAQQLLSDDAHNLSGEIRLTAPELLGDILASELRMLAKRHPALRLELVTGTPTALLSRKQTDIALLYDAGGQSDLVVEKRYTVGFGIYASRSYVRQNGKPAAIDRFAGHELIGFDDSVGHVAPLRWLRRGGRGATIIFRSNSLSARTAAARAGVGCALLPAMLGDAGAPLVRLLGPDEVGTLDLSLLVNGHVRASPRVAAVLRYVVDLIDERRAALAGVG